MPRFFRRLAEGVFDEVDLILRANQLTDFVANAAARYGLDDEKVIALGYSNGANIASAMLLLRPEVLRGAALLRPMIPFASADPPKPIPDLTGKSVLLLTGQHDKIAEPIHAHRLMSLLRTVNADAKILVLQSGHQMVEGDLLAVSNDLSSFTSGDA